MQKNEKKSRLELRQILLILVVAAAFYIVFDLGDRISAANEMNAKYREMATRVYGLQLTETMLYTQIARATQPSFLEDYIRPEGKLVQPGDIPIIPIPGDPIQTTQMVNPVSGGETYAKWEIWWDLFFGE